MQGAHALVYGVRLAVSFRFVNQGLPYIQTETKLIRSGDEMLTVDFDQE